MKGGTGECPGLRLGSNWCSILGGLAVLALLNRKDKDRRAVKPGRSREFGIIIFEQGVGNWRESWTTTTREHSTAQHSTARLATSLVPVRPS